MIEHARKEQMPNVTFEKFVDQQVFNKFDTDKNYLLSPKELGPIFEKYMNIIISEQEIQTMKYFVSRKYRRTEIQRKEFHDFIDLNFYELALTKHQSALFENANQTEAHNFAANLLERYDNPK